jgi:adenosylcobinamide-GDP ribazoletransferase
MAIRHELAGAITFMTRLPVPGVDPRIPLHRLAAWFPISGLLVGALAAGAYWLAGAAGLPPAVAAFAAILVEVAATGGIHLDGLADMADGLGGGTPERRLEIMKDPRLGSFGGIALVLALGGRGVLLAALPGSRAIASLVLVHAVCRWAPVWALARYPYARAGGGTGSAFSGAGWREVLLATVTPLPAVWWLGGVGGLVVFGVSALAGVCATAFAARKLGGITGDVCGAVIEVSLLAGLLVLTSRLPW